MTLFIEGVAFDAREIKQLYPAAMIPTGYGNELTQISLEWYDTRKDESIIAEKYGIFIHKNDKSVHPFFYQTREALEDAIDLLSTQLNG